jgi:hypothetical protein
VSLPIAINLLKERKHLLQLVLTGINTMVNLQGGGRSVVATKVIPPQQPEVAAQQPALPRTKIVSIENLAASTTEQQLKSLCQGIGVLEVSQNVCVCLAGWLSSLHVSWTSRTAVGVPGTSPISVVQCRLHRFNHY